MIATVMDTSFHHKSLSRAAITGELETIVSFLIRTIIRIEIIIDKIWGILRGPKAKKFWDLVLIGEVKKTKGPTCITIEDSHYFILILI
jgi:hypothetical protein